MSSAKDWAKGLSLEQVEAVFVHRRTLEDAGRLSHHNIPCGLENSYAWYALRCAYARADLEGVPFCWVCDDRADHLREVAKWTV